jgi:hypothetical protein
MIEILVISLLAQMVAISIAVAIAPRKPLLVADARPWPFEAPGMRSLD